MGLVLAVVVAQQLLTALEVSQRIPRSPAKKSTFRVVSLLNRLKSPRASDFVGKCKIMANPPCGKRRSCGAVDTELTVKLEEKKPGIMGTFFSIIGTF